MNEQTSIVEPKPKDPLSPEVFIEKKERFYRHMKAVIDPLYDMFITAKADLCELCPEWCDTETQRFTVTQSRFFEVVIDVMQSYVTDKSKTNFFANMKNRLNQLEEIFTITPDENSELKEPVV